MTEFTFYLAPLFFGVAGGLARGLRSQPSYRVPANDIGPHSNLNDPRVWIAANDRPAHIRQA